MSVFIPCGSYTGPVKAVVLDGNACRSLMRSVSGWPKATTRSTTTCNRCHRPLLLWEADPFLTCFELRISLQMTNTNRSMDKPYFQK